MRYELTINPEQKKAYYAAGYWKSETLLDYWKQAVKEVPEKLAVVDSHHDKYTYTEADKASDKIAAFLLSKGVCSGDIVSVQSPGWAEFTLIYIACLKVGAAINPILPNYRHCELSHILKKCRSKVLFMPNVYRGYNHSEMAESLLADIHSLTCVVLLDKYKELDTQEYITIRQILQGSDECTIPDGYNSCASDDLAAVLFTSGTEGQTKGVMLTHNNLIYCEKTLYHAFGIERKDCIFMPAPVTHSTGFAHGVTGVFIAKATSILQDIFEPDVSLGLIEHYQCTHAMGAAPFIHDILSALDTQNKKYDISSFKYFLCGGTTIPRQLVKKAKDKGVCVAAVYGATESSPHTAVLPDSPEDSLHKTDGKALPGIEVRVVDENHQSLPCGVEGEEASRGPQVFVGYLDEPELTAKVLDKEGWYYSGDLCVMDENGYIRITGRKKDMIVRGGENISGKELEDILLCHPKVAEAAIVAMPDERLGEKACAYVVLKTGVTSMSFEEVFKHFESHQVAKFKYPERLEIIDIMPRNPTGKIQKYILRQNICNALGINKEKDSKRN